MGPPPPPSDNNGTLLVGPPSRPSPLGPQHDAARATQRSLSSSAEGQAGASACPLSAVFHRRKAKPLLHSNGGKSSRELCKVDGDKAMLSLTKGDIQDVIDGHVAAADRGGRQAVGVVDARKILIEQSSPLSGGDEMDVVADDFNSSLPPPPSGTARSGGPTNAVAGAAAASDTIRKRIKFTMGDDEEEDTQMETKEEKEDHSPSTDDEQQKASESDRVRHQRRPSGSPKEATSPTASVGGTSKLRLRRTRWWWFTADSDRASVGQPRTHRHHEAETDGSASTTNNRKAKNKRSRTTTTTAATSNRTRSRFFRFNKHTIRAVVLLVVKLCGLLVASILIPSSKLVTAVDSGLDQSDPSASAAASNDDDEYADLMADGYASSTIIAVRFTNGNSPLFIPICNSSFLSCKS